MIKAYAKVAGVILGGLGVCFWGGLAQVRAVETTKPLGVEFEIRPMASLTLSSAMLHIDNLAPGGVAQNSNEITITATTNNQTGYVLYATVGNTTYNTTSLQHTEASVSDEFTSLAITDNLSNLENDNIWGYSINHGMNFGGLPLYSDANAKVISASVAPKEDQVSFLIGAKSGVSQSSGDYNNVITFRMVTNYVGKSFEEAFEEAGKPKVLNPNDGENYYTFQDMTPEICERALLESQIKLLDRRDYKTYWVAKLKMNREGTKAVCWMTENLDFDISAFTTLTPNDTDIPENWTPMTSTETVFIPSDWAVSNDNRKTPRSYDAGEKYYYTNNLDGGKDIIYHSLADCLHDGHFDCKHYQNGNYYNWTAAVAMNDSSGHVTENENINQSICPKGWRLPWTFHDNGGGGGGGGGGYIEENRSRGDPKVFKREMEQLWWAYEVHDGNGVYEPDGFKKVRRTPIFFSRSGSVWWSVEWSGISMIAEKGDWWTATVKSKDKAFENEFGSVGEDFSYMNLGGGGESADRSEGNSIRCLLRYSL